jgi:phosphoglycolate phosphatase
MARAFEVEFGVSGALGAVPMAGRTDAWIVAQAAAACGASFDAERLGRFRSTYLTHLANEVHQPGPRKGVMPGVRALLDALSTRQDMILALLTGNFAEGARAKLEYFDLWQYFRCGAFGDEAFERNDLLTTAFARVEACGLPVPGPSQVVVVGDTPLDIGVARAGGVRSVAVATGSYSRDALAAAGADVVLEDFSDLAATIAALEGGATEER